MIAAAFVIPLAVYARTLGPTIVGGDTGELVTSAYLLGVPHPTGYPLYMLLLHAWQWLPVGSIAYRSNLFSAVCMAAMCAGLAWAYLQAGGSRPGALLAALGAGFIAVVWSQAVVAEVYALNALLVVAIAALFIRWQRTRGGRALAALALVSGLALTHHRTAIFFAAPMLIGALLMHRPWSGRLAAKVALAFAAPLLLYLYLPLRAGAAPVANWGDPRTWGDFIRQVAGSQYFAYLRAPARLSTAAFLNQGLFRLPAAQLTLPGFALAVAGWGVLAWRRRALWALLSVGAALAAGMAARYRVSDAPVYLVPVYVLFAALLAVGAEAASKAIAGASPAAAPRRALSALVLVGLAAAVPARALWIGRSQENMSQAWQVYDAARVLLAEAEPRGLVLLSGDAPNGAAMYLQWVERMRPDLRVVWAEHAGHPWYDGALPVRGLAGVAARARRDYYAGKPPPGETWATWFVRQAALRYAALMPVYTNLSIGDLPAGYTTLAGREINRILPEAPSLLASDSPGPPRGSAPPAANVALGRGVRVLRAEPEPGAVKPGQVFSVRYEWRCEETIEQPLTVRVDFVRSARRSAPGAPAHFGVEQSLVYGLLPLAPTPPGAHYEQVVYYAAGRDLPPGTYLLYAALILPERELRSVPVAQIELEAGRGG